MKRFCWSSDGLLQHVLFLAGGSDANCELENERQSDPADLNAQYANCNTCRRCRAQKKEREKVGRFAMHHAPLQNIWKCYQLGCPSLRASRERPCKLFIFSS